MRTRTKKIVIASAASIICTVLAGAQIQQQAGPKNRADRKQEGFKCPVCGSPCVSKAALQRNKQQRMHAKRDRAPDQRAPARARQQRGRNPKRADQAFAPERGQRDQQREMRFDIDGDGQLSKAERAAMKAYRTEQHQEQSGRPQGRNAAQPPVE